MARFVLEVGCEEIPARFLAPLVEELRAGFSADPELVALRPTGVVVHAAPRRFCVLVDGLALETPVEEIIATGPPMKAAFDAKGTPTKAGLGFAASKGVDLADCFAHETEKGPYLAANVKTGGRQAVDILAELCPRLIAKLNFPKRMRWGDGDFLFARPLRWALALLDDAEIPFTLGTIHSGRSTWGHRVHGPGPFTLDHADGYEALLAEKCRVVVDADARKAVVRSRGDALAQEAGGAVVWDAGLLEEVAGLVEHPVPILGRFDAGYLELPREVLLTSIKNHQKSFGVEAPDGTLLPCFLAVANLASKDEPLVVKGWQRVLRARLEDAKFFWETDLKRDFADWNAKLDKVVFIGPLGSMGDRVRRIERLAGLSAVSVRPETGTLDALALARSATLCKADLVSEMVGEFAELQGIMGGIYAAKKGEAEAVGAAVRDQYQPQGPSASIPASLEGALLALADKADLLAGTFLLDMAPSSAADPYGLRRAALGVARIAVEGRLGLSITRLFTDALAGYAGLTTKKSPEQALEALLVFFEGRMKNFLQPGRDTLAVEAAVAAGFDDPLALARRAEALDRFAKRPDFPQAALTFKRAAGIIAKQAAGADLAAPVDPALFAHPAESALARTLAADRESFNQSFSSGDFSACLERLGQWRPLVDAFFDSVMVMDKDEAVRRNRLALLNELSSRLSRIADFSAMQI